MTSNTNLNQDTVLRIQQQLNCIRTNFHGAWPQLVCDGIYGPKTKQAIKAFKIYKSISPATEDIDSKTMHLIQESYNYVPKISTLKHYTPSVPQNNHSIASTFYQFFTEFANQILEFSEKEIDIMLKFRRNPQQILLTDCKTMIGQLSPQMKKIKDFCNEIKRLDDRKSKLNSTIPNKYKESLTQMINRKNGKESYQIKILTAQYNKGITKSANEYITQLKQLNIPQKIDSFLKSKGIIKDINIEALKKLNIKIPNIHLSSVYLLKILNFKDLIIDIFSYSNTETWRNKFTKDIHAFIDGMVIGYASAIIGQIAVVAIGAVGVTLSPVAIVILVSFITVCVCTALLYLMEETDVSFSEYALKGWMEIINLF